MNITRSTKIKLTKLAASLPRGDEGRRDILATLKSATVVARIAAEGVPRPFTKSDWYGFAGAESWDTGEQPWILDMDFRGNITKDLKLGQMDAGYLSEYGIHTQTAIVIADAEGVGIHFGSEDGDQGPMFYKNQRLEPEEAEGALKAVARYLKSGRLPPGYQHIN